MEQRIQGPERSESRRRIFETARSPLVLFAIVVLFFVVGLASDTRGAASGLQEVRVGSELDFPPYALVDKNGHPIGFSIELIKAVADAMGLSIKISTGSWDTLWNALVSGQLDLLPIVAKLPERQRLVDFSLPHTETYDAFFVRKGNPAIPNIAASRGKEIVVMRSDAAHHALIDRNFQGKLIPVDTIATGLELIASGKHDAMLCSKLIGTLSIKNHGITGLTAGPTIPDYKRLFSFAVKKGDTELLEKLNQGLLIVKTNGNYDRIYNKWLSFDDPWRKVEKYLLPAIIAVIAIAMIAIFWVVMLQLLVRKRTRELAEKNETLRHAYDDMEARVQERTMALTQSNQLLQTEIAEREQAEEQIRLLNERLKQQVAGLDAANKELESFSYSISHDLRTPLRAIDGFIRMILKNHTDKLDPDAADKFKVIRDNARMMGQLIDDLLAFSHLGRARLSTATVDVGGLIREVWEELKTLNPNRRLTLKIAEIPPGRGDRGLIKQVFVNILSNAIKFTKKHEEAIIEAGCDNHNGEIVYYIRDNGVGFDMRYHDTLFGVFQRLHSASEFEGTGVGLAIAQRIITRHGGKIWAEGEVDKGATFFFTLPAQQE